MIGVRAPHPSTLFGSTIVAPELLDLAASGDRSPAWVCVMLLILVIPRMYTATVDALRDAFIAYITRKDGQADPDAAPR